MSPAAAEARLRAWPLSELRTLHLELLALRNYPHLQLATATNGLCFTGLWQDAFLAQALFKVRRHLGLDSPQRRRDGA